MVLVLLDFFAPMLLARTYNDASELVEIMLAFFGSREYD